MSGERPDPVLILCKAAGWGWPTASAIIPARPGGKGTSSQALDTAFANFERLSPATAQRVMRFWQVAAAPKHADRLRSVNSPRQPSAFSRRKIR